MSLIEKKLNDEVWTETLVLEEADRVQRPGPADPRVKITTKKPDKRKKQSKHQQTTEESMYLVSNRVGTMEVYWRVHVNVFFQNLLRINLI